jgi:hypothetical protein
MVYFEILNCRIDSCLWWSFHLIWEIFFVSDDHAQYSNIMGVLLAVRIMQRGRLIAVAGHAGL